MLGFIVEKSVIKRFVQFATLIAVTWLFVSCGGGGSTGSGIMITPPPTQRVPDLQLSIGEGRYDNVAPGSSFTVTAVVENAGMAEASPTSIRWLRSDSSTIAATDTPQGSTSIDRLNGGEYVSESFPFTAPNQNGVYYFGACVDEVAGETNTRNNCGSSVVRINVGNLQISVGEGRFDNVAPDSTFTVNAVVQYIGSGQSSPARLRWYRSSDAIIQSTDTELGNDLIPALSSGTSSSESFQFTAPSAFGTYYYGACLDQASRVNVQVPSCASETVRVTVVQRNSDLTVSFGAQRFDNVQPGSTFRISAVIQNIGAGQSSSTTLRWLRSATTTIRRTDVEQGTSSVGRLDRGESFNASNTITVPDTEGTYYFGACVDPPDNEINSNNNCSTDVVTIEVSVTLQVTVSTRQLRVAPVSRITLYAVVQNVSTGRSNPTSIRWYRSSDNSIGSNDTSEGTSSIGALSSGQYEEISFAVDAPLLEGTYYYGACVSENNCSRAISITVVE